MTENFMQPPDARSVIHGNSRSFSLAAKFLPLDVRRHAEMLYAWCRWCDDAVDSAPNKAVARNQLQLLRADVQRVYEGKTTEHAASSWLAAVVTRCGIPIDLPMDLLNGMEMDLEDRPVQSEQDLELYCYRVAGTVGLMMSRVLGTSHPEALRRARSLGIAMQRTNIARDVREDWLRGRCYLPQDWIEEEGRQDKLPTNECVAPAVRRLLDLADQEYRQGFLGIRDLPSESRPAIFLAAKAYKGIGDEIRRRDYRVMDGRATVGMLRLVGFGFNALCYGGWMRVDDCLRGNTHGRGPLFSDGQTNRTLQEKTMNKSKKDAGYLIAFSLSLTLIMATALFVLMAINPKDAAYSSTPLIYAGLSAVGAIGCGLLARRYDSHSKEPV